MSEMLVSVEDCLEMYRRLEPCSLDLIAEDPPAGIKFASAKFDTDRGGRAQWVEWLTAIKAAEFRAAKPGAYSVTWGLPRTSHWTATAIEDAGWILRDVIHHCFGQGWNKNPALLRPGHEHWILAQKPVEKGMTIDENVAKWGTGKLNIEASRVRRNWAERGEAWMRSGHSAKPVAKKISGAPAGNGLALNPEGAVPTTHIMGHCPECGVVEARPVASSQLDHDCSGGNASPYGTETIPALDCLAVCEACALPFLSPSGGDAPSCPQCGAATWWACPVASLDEQCGERPSGGRSGAYDFTGIFARDSQRGKAVKPVAPSTGGASRFFKTFYYAAKSSASERHAGCGHLLWAVDGETPFGYRRVSHAEWLTLPEADRAQGCTHPTVKSLDLCRWLLTLIAPPSGPRRGADGFCGSGSFAIAAEQLGIDWTTCDTSSEAIAIAQARLNYWRGGLHIAMPARPSRKRVARPVESP